jgi:hypothetical protein
MPATAKAFIAASRTVRVYPILFKVRSACVILCRPCWGHENGYRHQSAQAKPQTYWRQAA